MIRFEKVTKIYADTNETALLNVSFHMKPGEMAFLMGESGSGKTTLLRLLLRELTADSGSVFVNGEDISRIRQNKVPQYRRRLGIVFQDFKLLKEQSVYDNVALAKRVIGAKEQDIRSQVAMALRIVGMEKEFYRPVSELSGGEQQKVCTARAIVGNPYCILADEPTGNLDPKAARELMLLFEKINSLLGITVLIATHDKAAVSAMPYQRLYLENGILKKSGE